MRAVQYFTQEYLEHCRALSTSEILQFLEDFRQLHAKKPGSRLISLKVPDTLLAAFKTRARIEGVRYQTQIKALMEAWVKNEQAADDLR